MQKEYSWLENWIALVLLGIWSDQLRNHMAYLRMVRYPCNSSYLGGRDRMMLV
jgi:hypothetical protein